MTLLQSFTDVCSELDRRRRITLGFGRIETLLTLLVNPERDLRIVQVVGTNGKGTTAVALAGALESAGHAAGAYLSPHVLSYTERVMVHGGCVSEERFAAAMGEVMDLADANRVPASQFELLTAGALKIFGEEGVEWAVLEAGLGARYDATTAAGSEAVVLTNVGLDHTEYLGASIEEIAREKLASLPAGGALILGTSDPVVVEMARAECARVGARLFEAPASGRETPYKARNITLGLRTAEVLLGESLGEEVCTRLELGMEGALPGRYEMREMNGVPVVVDGGHNPAGLEAALEAVRCMYGRRPLGVVFGALREKDIGSMLNALREEAHALVLARPASERAADPGWIEREYGPRDLGGRRARVEPDSSEALNMIVREMKEIGGMVLVTGSLYMGAAVLGELRED